MGWKQAGYGICPTMGAKAPCVNAGYDENTNKTVFTISFNGKIDSEETIKLADNFYDMGKDFYND